jgi:hypothetical protein
MMQDGMGSGMMFGMGFLWLLGIIALLLVAGATINHFGKNDAPSTVEHG